MSNPDRESSDDGLRINEPWVVVTGVVIAIIALHWLFRDFQASASADFLTYATKNFFSASQWPLILAGLFSPFALARWQNRLKSNYVDIAGYLVGVYCGGRFLLDRLNTGAVEADFAQFIMTLSLAAAFAVGMSGPFAGLAQHVDRKTAAANRARSNRRQAPDTVDSAGFTSDYFEFDPRVFLYGDDFLDAGRDARGPEGGGQRQSSGAADRPGPADTSRREPLKALPFYRRPVAYTSDEARRMFDISGIHDLPPSNTDGAVSLASAYILSLGWERAREFIHAAARDEDLPKRMRDFYIHALVVLDQLRREAELHNMGERFAAE